jgi:hypothetical protein
LIAAELYGAVVAASVSVGKVSIIALLVGLLYTITTARLWRKGTVVFAAVAVDLISVIALLACVDLPIAAIWQRR